MRWRSCSWSFVGRAGGRRVRLPQGIVDAGHTATSNCFQKLWPPSPLAVISFCWRFAGTAEMEIALPDFKGELRKVTNHIALVLK
jgi:hypothetical protein